MDVRTGRKASSEPGRSMPSWVVQRDALLPLRRPHQAVERGQITGQLTQRIAFLLPFAKPIVDVSG